MLKSRHNRSRPKKVDWYPRKRYLHFDLPLSRDRASELVTSPERIERHRFLPLMAFEKRDRKYRRRSGGAAQILYKIRNIAYCSNIDACVFGYYAEILVPAYEKIIRELNIEDVVIGYRSVGSNIDLALQAFQEIQSRGACVAFAFDISGFFDNIDHGVLKRNWSRVLNVSFLPADHYKIFRNLTRFSYVNKRAVLNRLGLNASERDSQIRQPLCSIAEFRAIVKGEDGIGSNLVRSNSKAYGIPQGTPISAIAANISMIEFDIRMKALIRAMGGSYRRYSDDILVIVPIINKNYVEDVLLENIKLYTRRLKINKSKTDVVEFPALPAAVVSRPLQYLGFQFDGSRILLRSSTIARYHRRMHKAVGRAFAAQKQVLCGKRSGRAVIYKRSVYADVTHLGSQNFVTSYAKNSHVKMNSSAIRRQMAGHMRKLRYLLGEVDG